MNRKAISLLPLFFSLLLMLFPLAYGYNSRVNVGVYLYGWYNDTTHNWLVDYPSIRDRPVIGFYNSTDNETITAQFEQITECHIDFVILSWWGESSYTDTNIKQVFTIVKEQPFPVKLCLIIEPFNESYGVGGYNFTRIYEYVNETFVSPYHDTYFRVNCPLSDEPLRTKPLLLFYNAPNMTGSGVVPDTDIFETKIVGHQPYVEWLYHDLTENGGNPLPVPTRQRAISPRYDDTGTRDGNRIYDGDYYEEIYKAEWRDALKGAKNNSLDFITICSWNEYHERTEIEPHYDATSDKDPFYLLNLTKTYIEELKDVGTEPLIVKAVYWYQNPFMFGVLIIGVALGVVILRRM